MWHSIETAPSRQIVLVCNPKEGGVPVVAKLVGEIWYNIGAVPVGITTAYHLEPEPMYWMPIQEMPE